MTDTQEWSLWIPCRVWTTNEERKRGWHWRASRVKALRAQMCVAAREAGIPFCDEAEFDVTPTLKRLLQDVGGCFPVVKALIDGLVDAGVLLDDGPKYVGALTFRRPIRGTEEGVTITIKARPCNLFQ